VSRNNFPQTRIRQLSKKQRKTATPKPGNPGRFSRAALTLSEKGSGSKYNAGGHNPNESPACFVKDNFQLTNIDHTHQIIDLESKILKFEQEYMCVRDRNLVPDCALSQVSCDGGSNIEEITRTL
jgi:hypothetical protein